MRYLSCPPFSQQTTIAGKCRTNPWPAVPDWTLIRLPQIKFCLSTFFLFSFYITYNLNRTFLLIVSPHERQEKISQHEWKLAAFLLEFEKREEKLQKYRLLEERSLYQDAEQRGQFILLSVVFTLFTEVFGSYLSAFNYSFITKYCGCGLAYPYDWRGFVGAKQTTSVDLLVYYSFIMQTFDSLKVLVQSMLRRLTKVVGHYYW